jgi:nudix-type nucleoside diphosphatase (YffH/AdpP family)
MLDDDAPEACATREAWEETGVRVKALRHAFDVFTSPGGMTEKISCFVASYAAADRRGPGGGVDADEFIELIEMPYADVFARIASGEIRDAKTVALLYYAKAEGLF